MPERLLVVANRLPLTVRLTAGRWHADRSSGGLVAALDPVMQRANGMWIGWPGEAPADDPAGRATILRRLEEQDGLASVELPASISRSFYEGYSNNTLWPLLHGFPTRVAFDAETFHAYQDANRRFADAVLDRLRPDDLVWIQDYQLLLLPSLIRERRPDARIAFFLHVPFPAPETFRILPEREALLRGLLGADVLGFQTYEHLGAFRRTLLAVLGLESHMDRLEIDGRTVHLKARPIGLAVEEWEHLVTFDGPVAGRVRELRAGYAGRQLIVAVDRLDYTKGIPERLRALRHLFAAHPERRGRVTLIQVAVPTREGVPRYAQLRREVNELVGEINGELGTADWNPVVYLRRSVPKRELAALYAAADVAWIGSLRDGMNLVAKEYVVCQANGGGVLLLSEFAGAAGEMGEAIRINPYDEPGAAEALERALSMPEDERLERQAALLARIRTNTATAWAERSLGDLREAVADRVGERGVLPAPDLDGLRRRYNAADRRTCYLDVDGTLVPIAARPRDAVPSAAVVEVVRALAARPGTTVAIVSGRGTADLDRWFGDTGVWLAAEHGALLRAPGADAWTPLHAGADAAWKARVRPILDHFAERAPGSLVEDKALSVAWHYRLVEPESGAWLANELSTTLDHQLAGTELAVLRGNKVIEVRFAWATKGEVAAHVRASAVDVADLELAIGDDRTDEDLFERLGEEAVTIRVGPGHTRARYRLDRPAAVVALLGALAADPGPVASGSAPVMGGAAPGAPAASPRG